MRSITKKLLCMILVLVFSASLLLSGCGGGTKPESQNKPAAEAPSKAPVKKVTLRYAHTYTGAEAIAKDYEAKLKDFAEKHKDTIELKVEPEQGDNLRTKIKTDLAANNLPDVFSYWTRGSIKPMVDAGLLLNVDEFFAKSKTLKKDMWEKGSFDAYTFDGGKTNYGIPVEKNMSFFLVNKKLFEKYNLKYPTTYEELKSVSKVFADNGIIPIAVGSKGGNPGHWFFAALLFQYMDTDTVKKITNGTERFDSPVVERVANYVLEMAKNRTFPKDTIGNGDYGPAVSLFNEGKAAMMHAYSWLTTKYTPEITKDSEIIPIPKLPDSVIDPAKFAVGGSTFGLVINKKSFEDPAKQAAIIEFVEHVLSDDTMKLFIKSGRAVTRNVDISGIELSPMFKKVIDYGKGKDIENRVSMWALLPNPVAQEVYSFGMDEIWAQTIGAKPFLEKVQKAIDKGTK